jgi:hypothetical protein
MSITRSHEQIEELVAADALDGLEPAERDRLVAEMAAHGPDCPDCARLLTRYSEVAGWLALALHPAPLTEGAEERLIAAARGEPEHGEPEHGGAAERPMPAAPPVTRWRRWVATAAAAAVLAAVGGAAGWALAPRGGGTNGRFLAFVARPGIQVATLTSAQGRTLAVAYRPGERTGWVLGTGLPDPAGGHVYELWYRPGGTSAMRPAGTFVPGGGGAVTTEVELGGSFDALAVSVEPAGGSAQPTTQPIYLLSL